MNIWKFLILIILVIFLGWGIFKLEYEKKGMTQEYLKVKEITDKLFAENQKTKEQIDYYQNPENLLKASREQFNFKNEGEQMIIIVPKVASTTP
ncbi:hypothetical protein C4565_02220 [Candidatus Parcubacteria bacterium]|jgi:cell division protein FtsB|nr:MAG: hypothetical protein C4565_02220 [Candidatus Parcubacteria bacterium]